jgi:hypothetical protein
VFGGIRDKDCCGHLSVAGCDIGGAGRLSSQLVRARMQDCVYNAWRLVLLRYAHMCWVGDAHNPWQCVQHFHTKVSHCRQYWYVSGWYLFRLSLTKTLQLITADYGAWYTAAVVQYR